MKKYTVGKHMPGLSTTLTPEQEWKLSSWIHKMVPKMQESKLSSISSDGTLLAICSCNGTLKLWDTSSNILEHEFHPGEYLTSSITCLKFSPKGRKTSFKNKKKKSIDKSTELFIALGTLDGAILIYSPDKQKVVNKFNHSSSSSVTDISWESPDTFISVGENKKLIVWNIDNTKLYSLDTIESKSFCAFGKNEFVVGSTNLQFLQYDKKTKEASRYVIPAHKTFITQLVPIFLDNEKGARYVLSSAQNDRYVYAWSTTSQLNEPVGSFMVKDCVRTVSCFNMDGFSVGIVVTTKTGLMRYFQHHFNGSKNVEPLTFRGTLKIKSKTLKNEHLMILNAQFLSTTEILIVYGSELFPRCERISIESLVDKVCLTRKDPGLFSKSTKVSLGKTITPAVPDSAVYLAPSQMNPVEMKEVNKKRKKGGEANLPMEERLDALSLTQPLPGDPVGRPLDNYVHLLVQALHSKDSALMNNILSKGEDEEIINNTVRRLPATQVVPFLLFLQEVLAGKGLKNLTCINWVKSVLYHHMSLLSTIPDKENLLQPFYAVFAARTSCFLAVTKLHARISLLLTHVKNRHENVTQNVTNSHSEALLKYRDDSSDEEDMRMEVEGGPSESEDIWDDWTEDEEEEEEEDGEKESRKAAKRKLNDENFIGLEDMKSDDGDEEEEEEEEEEVKDFKVEMKSEEESETESE